MLGTPQVIILNIAPLLFLHLPLPLLNLCRPVRTRNPLTASLQPLKCFFPGRTVHFAWISTMTLPSGNNTQEALLSRSGHKKWATGPTGPGWQGRSGVLVKMSISCSNRMQRGGLESRFSYPIILWLVRFSPSSHLHLELEEHIVYRTCRWGNKVGSGGGKGGKHLL